jgi:predicted nucleic acid-binding protein
VVWNPEAAQWAQVPALMKKYANLPMDLADASLVLLAEHLGHGRVLTTDTRDFGTYRWKSRKPFKNVLQEMKP